MLRRSLQSGGADRITQSHMYYEGLECAILPFRVARGQLPGQQIRLNAKEAGAERGSGGRSYKNTNQTRKEHSRTVDVQERQLAGVRCAESWETGRVMEVSDSGLRGISGYAKEQETTNTFLEDPDMIEIAAVCRQAERAAKLQAGR